MKWTPLHAALGLGETELTFAMVEAAIADEVAESQALEFKRNRPLSLPEGANKDAKDKVSAELAKDVAAMANAGGGLVLFGVDETRTDERSVATNICDVGGYDEKLEEQIRRCVSNFVYPPVRNVEFIWLSEEQAAEGSAPRTVLALLVPESLERPHLVHPRSNNTGNWFQAPYRDGPHTAFMPDRMLQSAYNDRDRGQQRLDQSFEDRFNDVLAHTVGPGWVVFMASPQRLPSMSAAADFPKWQADEIFELGLKKPNHFGPGVLLNRETRTGLRRFSRRHAKEEQGSGITRSATLRAYAEVHSDGTVALAFTRDGSFPNAYGQMPPGSDYRTHVAHEALRTVVEDAARLLSAMRAERGAVGSYRARLAVPGVSHFRRVGGGNFGAFHEPDEILDGVAAYRPIEGWLSDAVGDESIFEGLVDMLRDAFDQAGAHLTIEDRAAETATWLATFKA